MAQQIAPARHVNVNTILKYVGLCILLLALIGVLLDLLDWRVRKTTMDVSSYTFSGNTIVFSGMTNGNIAVTAGPGGKVTIVHRLTEGIRKLHVSERARGNSFAVQESGGCNNGVSLALFGSCTSQYQVQVPVNTTVIAHASGADISVEGVNGNHQVQTDDGDIKLRDVVAQSASVTTHNGMVTAVQVHVATLTAKSANGDIMLQLLGSPGTVMAHSNNGKVSIRLQDNATAYKTITASSNGKVTVGIKTDSHNSQNSIAASSDNGDVSLSY